LLGFSTQHLMAIPSPTEQKDPISSQFTQVAQQASNDNLAEQLTSTPSLQTVDDSTQSLSNKSTYPIGYEEDGLRNQQILQSFKETKSISLSKLNKDNSKGTFEFPKEDPNAPDYEVKTQNLDDKTIKSEYSKGLKNGFTTITNKNNIIEMNANFSRNKLDGPTKYYYSDGKIEREVTFKQGKMHGIMTSFNTNGKKAMEVDYEDGQMHGVSKVYDESGLEQVISHYQKGKLHGEMTLFSNGKPYMKKMYDQGIEVPQGQGSQYDHTHVH